MVIYLQTTGLIRVYSIGNNQKSNFKAFFLGLQRSDQMQLMRLIERIASTGEIKNTTQFKTIGDDVWELKTSNAFRVYCFWSKRQDLQRSLIISHGTKKKNQAALNKEKKKVIAAIKKFRSEVLDIRC